jgi:2-keto-4-pentenoate hydratase/2-oxohepta-3-ene-1,7-dioic acid hydratase in catechol pathway
MRLLTFVPGGDRPRAARDWRIGVLTPDGDAVIDAARALAWWRPTSGFVPPADPLAWYDLDGATQHALARLDEAVQVDDTLLAQLRRNGFVVPLADVSLGSPVPRPGKIVCVGLNYRDHAAEARMPVPESPVIFAKFATAVIGPDMPIVIPPASGGRVDYEAELAIVIGRMARRLTADEAAGCVLGYMNANDVSERTFQKQDGQWVRAKSADSFAPMGPWIVSAADVPDPDDLAVRLRLNGETLQDSRTREFVFGIEALLVFLSATMTLEPGDVILTGTPPGVGFARKPPIFLRPGDVVEVDIEGLGVLRNPVATAE